MRLQVLVVFVQDVAFKESIIICAGAGACALACTVRVVRDSSHTHRAVWALV
jgi:hypothetical protein